MNRERRRLVAVLLAAGYGTRLGELGRTTPKALLTLPGTEQQVADHLIGRIRSIPELLEVVLVTNRRFRPTLEEWAASVRDDLPVPLRVICNGTREPDERLGAVRDLALAVQGSPGDRDFMVLATDTGYDFALAPFVRAFRDREEADLLVPLIREDPGTLSRRGVAALDRDGYLVDFQEKPRSPRSRDTVPPLYLMRSRAVPTVQAYLREGGDPDALGSLLEWLVAAGLARVGGWRAPGRRWDLGDPGAHDISEPEPHGRDPEGP